MAILADSNDERNGAAPIGAHPAFPGIVAMWFAALLGLGALVLPAALIERLVLASGIVSLVPAANPPLGFTERAFMAGAAAATGALAGFAAARRIAAAHAGAPSTGRAGEAAVRPLSAREELGDLLDWTEPDSSDREDFAQWVDPVPRWQEEANETTDLARLVERLALAIQRGRARSASADCATPAAPELAPELAMAGYVSDDTEAALRVMLERLRHLREAA